MVNKSLDIAEETGVHVYDSMLISILSYSWLGIGDFIQLPPILAKLKATLTTYAVWDQAQYHWLVAWYAIQAGNLIEAQDQIETAVELVDILRKPFHYRFMQYFTIPGLP